VSGVGELRGHDRIHRDHHVAFDRHLLVPVLDLLADPLLEGLADDSRDHIHNPLFGSLRQILVVREEVSDVWLADDEFEDLLNRE